MTFAPIWVLPLLVYFVGTVSNTILQRKIALHDKMPSRLLMFLTFALFLYPIALIVALSLGNFWINWQPATVLALFFDALGMGLYFTYALHLNRNVEAVQYTVITNMYTPVTVILGVVVLQNHMTDMQFVAMLLLIFGAMLVAAKKFTRQALTFDGYTGRLLLISIGLGVGLAAERACLNYMSPSTYMVLGYGLQTSIIAIFSFKYWKLIPKITGSHWSNIAKLGISRTMWNLGFLFSVVLSANVSLVATASSFRVPLIFIASLFFLSERDNLKRKFIGVIIATVGLLLI